MSNADLFTALNMFKKGVQEFSTSAAINQATEQVQQIKSNVENEGQQRQQLQGLANDLALRLASTGATGQQIEASFKAISPQQFGSAEQAQLSGALQGDSFVEETGERLIKEREERKLNQLLKAQQAKQAVGVGKETRSAVRSRQKEFNRLSNKIMQSLDQVAAARNSLSKSNPVADQAIKTMLARASGEVGNLTEAEREMFAGSPALQSRAKRLLKLQTLGTLPQSDRRDLQELLSIYESSGTQAVRSRANLISNQMAQNLGIEKERALDFILPESVRENLGRESGVSQEQTVDVSAGSGTSTPAPQPTATPAPTPSIDISNFIVSGRR